MVETKASAASEMETAAKDSVASRETTAMEMADEDSSRLESARTAAARVTEVTRSE